MRQVIVGIVGCAIGGSATADVELVSYQADTACPVLGEVSPKFNISALANIEVAVTAQSTDEGFLVNAEWSDSDKTRQRSVMVDECVEGVETLAVLNRLLASEFRPSNTDRPPAPHPPPTSLPSQRLRLVGATSFGKTGDYAPQIAIGYRYGELLNVEGLAGYTTRSHAMQSESLATMRLYSGQLRGGYRLARPRLSINAGAAADVGAYVATGATPGNPQSTELWLAAGVFLELEWFLSPRIGISADTTALIPLTRHTYLTPLSEPIYQPSQVAAQLGISANWHF